MSGKTGIQWTDKTWNPVRGCTRVSEGCRNCYAERQAHRFSGQGGAYEGLTRLVNGHPAWTGAIKFVDNHLLDPLRWKEPCNIFVNSMSDLFHEGVTDEMRHKIFAVMTLCPQHRFQVLTKRPGTMKRYLCDPDIMRERWQVAADQIIDNCAAVEDRPWPLPNFWPGVSCENQPTADARIPLLLQTPAAVRFISAEPLLGPINIEPYICRDWRDGTPQELPKLDWVIVGGESGPGARPCDAGWIRSIVNQCKSASVPCFVKQLGRESYYGVPGNLQSSRLEDSKGGDISEWPEDLRIREFPREAVTA